MTDVVVKHGREFEFDDGVPEDVRAKRIANWMRKNAPDELGDQTPAPKAPRSSGVLDNIWESLSTPAIKRDSPVAPSGSLRTHMASGPQRMSDPNFYRTLAQGAFPAADEAIAGIRSLAGTPYDTALSEERQGIKDYGDKYGEMDKIGTELLGTGLTLPFAAAATAPLKGTQALQWMLRNPWKSAVGTGATTGGAAGFAAGEGGPENRLDVAKDHAILGGGMGVLGHAGVRGVEKLSGWASGDNRVASLLRRKMAEREAMATSPTLPRDKHGNIDPETEQFTREGMTDLRRDMADQRGRLYTDPMLADALPNMTEQVLQKPGPQTAQLTRNLLKRQYDPTLPDVTAAAKSQRGRVENAFDLAFGADTFKHTDEQLLKTLRTNADAAFKPAYTHNIRSAEIDDALDRIRTLNPGVWTEAKKWADSERRSIGAIDVTGDLRSYNTQFLHDIKRSMDSALGEAGRLNPKFNDKPYLDAKIALNDAMKKENPLYKTAMERYGDDASHIGALKKGREEVFVPGSTDVTGGMDPTAIKAFLSDPTVTQAEKDLFKLGAARALRESTVGSGSKKYTHNWADFIGQPTTKERMESLLSDKLGSWDLLKSQLGKESQNYKQFSSALGNSRTNARKEMTKELDDVDIGRLAAGMSNPHAFGSVMTMVNMIKNKIDPGTRTAQRGAEILGRTGAGGNRSALRDIEDLLRAQDARRAAYGNRSAFAPAATAYAWPYREEQF